MRAGAFSFSAVLVAAILAACGNDYALQNPGDDAGAEAGAPLTDSGSSGTPAGPSDAAVDNFVPPPACDTTADPKDAPDCIDDDFAVFVDPAASAGGNGTKAHPKQTIADGLEQAHTNGKSYIIICGSGPFAEHVAVTEAVRLIGGFACGTWTPAAGTGARVAPSDPGYALQLTSVSGLVQVEDMSFEAGIGTDAAPSSIAVFVSGSSNVVFKRVTMKSGFGVSAHDGKAGETGTPTPGDLSGSPATSTAGGKAKTCTCTTGGTSVGGGGGDLASVDGDGTAGLPTITPSSPTSATGTGQTQAECNNGAGVARTGSAAPNAPDAPAGGLGTLSSTGWTPGDGATGQSGPPGQGGGGGGARSVGAPTATGSGGGGGCGGCGGGGGVGGKGGGSSIALLSFGSTIELDACTLTAANAGNAGNGGAGALGAAGGAPGVGFQGGCAGARGGAGGNGGNGAGGAGGLSVAVLYSGTAPVNNASTLSAGAAGHGGVGGGSFTAPNGGPDGLTGQIVQAP